MKKTIDWKFWVALSVAMMIGYLMYVGKVSIDDSNEKDKQIDKLISSIERGEKRSDAQLSEANRRGDEILAYTKDLAERQRALLAYLRENGIDIPVRYLRQIQPPESFSGSSTSPPSSSPRQESSSSPRKSTSPKGNSRSNKKSTNKGKNPRNKPQSLNKHKNKGQRMKQRARQGGIKRGHRNR